MQSRWRSLPLAAPTGPKPRDSADVLLERETATPSARRRRRLRQVGAGVALLVYAGSFLVPQIAEGVGEWQGQDRYEKKELIRR